LPPEAYFLAFFSYAGKEMMMRYVIVWTFLFVAVFTSSAMAHSTQGRLKVDLKKDQPTVDDVAFYVEAYVNRVKYAESGKMTKNRFIVDEFLQMEYAPGSATVTFRVLDKKENRKFEDTVVFKRTNKKRWINEADGDKVIYTYVNKAFYNYTHYILPGFGVTALLASLSYLSTRLKQRRRRLAADQNRALESSE